MRRVNLLVSVAIMSSVLAGCSDKDKSKGQLLLYCGAGIRPPVAELAKVFGDENGVEVITDYAGSELLLAKIKLVNKGDLYMPGDKHYVDQAAEAGLIQARKSVCYFVPTILVQKSNPKKIAGLKDLLRPGVRLGLGDERACAVGRKSKAIFEKNGIAWSHVEKNVAFKSLTVNDLGMQIEAKSLDAAIVWDAVANYYPDNCEAVVIPADQNIISTVDVGVLKFSEQQELAEKFVEFAASDRGRAVFARHNYRVDPPAASTAK